VAARRPTENVAELPGEAVHVSDGEVLHGRVLVVVQRREDGVRAKPGHGEAPAVVGIRRRENLGERNNLFVIFLRGSSSMIMKGSSSSSEDISNRLENHLCENLIGERIGKKSNSDHVAGNEGSGQNRRGDVSRRRRGLIKVSLSEVVNHRIWLGDFHRRSCAGLPYRRFQSPGLLRRWWWRLPRHCSLTDSKLKNSEFRIPHPIQNIKRVCLGFWNIRYGIQWECCFYSASEPLSVTER